jgi:uncharacterized protein involved in exopolysaccharide biosynthesis/Mrp family chromosome partitioning ATPase
MVQTNVNYFQVLRHYRWLAIMVFALVIVAALVGSLFQQKIYSVHAEIYVEPKPAAVVGDAESHGAEPDGRQLNNQVEILGSDMVAGKAVEYIRAKLGQHFPVSVAELEKNLSIAQKENSSVITLDLSAAVTPRQLQHMMQEYLHAYRDTLETLNSDKSAKEHEFLEQQLAAARSELTATSAKLRDFEASNHAYNLDEQTTQMLQLANGLEEQSKFLASDIQAATREITASQTMLPASADSINLMARIERDPEATDLRKRLITVETEKAEWGSKVTEAHPKMQVYNRELERLKGLLTHRLTVLSSTPQAGKTLSANDITTGSNLDISLAEGVIKSRIKLDTLQAKAAALAAARADIMSRLSGLPRQALTYAALKNDFDMAQDKVKMLQKRLDDAALRREVSKTFTKVEMLKNPSLPTSPVRPNLVKNLAAGILLGFCLALFAVFVRSSMDRSLHWPFQLKGLGQFPIFELDALPSLKTFAALMERGNVVLPDAYKRLLVHLDDLSVQKQVRRIGLMPVGNQPNRAVSTVLLSLYATEMGHKVTLIDTDFSNRSATELLTSLRLPISAGIQAGPGLSDYLCGQVDDVVDIIYPLGKTVYGSLIPSGEPISGGAAFLQRNLSQLEENLSPNYKFVFYGLPSVRQSYDAVALGRSLDGVFLCVHPGYSNLDEIRQAIQELETVHARVLGLIMHTE